MIFKKRRREKKWFITCYQSPKLFSLSFTLFCFFLPQFPGKEKKKKTQRSSSPSVPIEKNFIGFVARVPLQASVKPLTDLPAIHVFQHVWKLYKFLCNHQRCCQPWLLYHCCSTTTKWRPETTSFIRCGRLFSNNGSFFTIF